MEAGDLLWWSLKGAAERVIMMTVFDCLVLDFALALCRHFLCIMFCISIIFPASPLIVWTHSLVTEYILWIMSLLHIRVTENWGKKGSCSICGFFWLSGSGQWQWQWCGLQTEAPFIRLWKWDRWQRWWQEAKEARKAKSSQKQRGGFHWRRDPQVKLVPCVVFLIVLKVTFGFLWKHLFVSTIKTYS